MNNVERWGEGVCISIKLSAADAGCTGERGMREGLAVCRDFATAHSGDRGRHRSGSVWLEGGEREQVTGTYLCCNRKGHGADGRDLGQLRKQSEK